MKNERVWYAVPALWIPVLVVVQSAAFRRVDALQQAILDFVDSGRAEAASIASHLCISPSLVAGAMERLLASNVLIRDESGTPQRVEQEEDAEPTTETHPGWLAFDPYRKRLLPEVFLGLEPPERASQEAPSGWSVCEQSSTEAVSRPSARDIESQLQLLPTTASVVVTRRVGTAVESEEGAQHVRRLLYRVGQGQRVGSLYIPVEHRPHGPIVRRPAVAPTVEIRTELDPTGARTLLQRLTPEQQRSFQSAQRNARETLVPWLLEALGYASLVEFDQSVEREAKRVLGNAWHHLSQTGQEEVRCAIRQQATAQAMQASWREVAGGWADVLEVMTLHARTALMGQDYGGSHTLSPHLKSVLGVSFPHVQSVLKKPGDRTTLKSKIAGDRDTIGDRILFLGLAVAVDPQLQDRLKRATNDTTECLFDALDTSNRARITIIHHREQRGTVDPAAFRANVITVTRGLARLFPAPQESSNAR